MSNEIIYRKNRITNADLVSGNCLLSHAMTGDTLAADTLDFRIWSDTGLGKVDADFLTADEKTITTQDGKVFRCFVEKDLTDFVAGDSVEYKRDGKLVGKFYLRNVKRSYKFYDFTCISAIGILGDTLHYGGIYTGETVAEVAAEILEGLPYEIDPIVGDIKLYGWLPIDTKRNNLQQITIATVIAVKTKPDGTLLLTALSNDIKGTIGDNRMVVGANVEVDKPYSAVQVTEHYFQAIDEEIILFSESSVKTEFLKFNEPVHDLTVTGGTLIEWGAGVSEALAPGHLDIQIVRGLDPSDETRWVFLTPTGALVIVGGENGGALTGGIERQFGARIRSAFTRRRLGFFISSEARAGLHELVGLLESGAVRPTVDTVRPLSAVRGAIDDLTAGRIDRKSTRLNSSHPSLSRMPSSA